MTTRVEHPAVLNTCEILGESRAIESPTLPVDRDGNLDLDHVDDAITDDTAIVSIMWANNETGVIFDVERIGRNGAGQEARFSIPTACRRPGKIPINLPKPAIDMLALSGHKLHAPKGIGVLYVRKGTRFCPFDHGRPPGARPPRRHGKRALHHRPGQGRELAAENLERRKHPGAGAARQAGEGLLESIPNVFLTGTRNSRLPNTISISFEYVEGESILLLMDNLGICASSGSACTSGIPGTLPRAPRHGRALHGGARIDPLQPQRLQHGTRKSISCWNICRTSSPDSARFRPSGRTTSGKRVRRERVDARLSAFHLLAFGSVGKRRRALRSRLRPQDSTT